MTEAMRRLPGDTFGKSNTATETATEKAAVPVVVFDEATVAYDQVPVLTNVHGTIEVGRAVAVIGPHGAGKSILIKTILGMVPVASGSVTVLGRPPAQARRQIAYVPQAGTLDAEFPVTVTQVVLTGRYRWIGWVRRPTFTDRAVASHALRIVGLTDRARDRFTTLSVGQRQRVLLARAIAQRPRLLLLDEPFDRVDALSQQALLATLTAMRSDGTSVVISSHDLALAHLTCDDTCLLNRRQFGFGPTAVTLTQENLRAVYGRTALEPQDDSAVAVR